MMTPELEPEPEQPPEEAVGFGDAAGLWSAAAGLQSFPTTNVPAVAVVASLPSSLPADRQPLLQEMVTVLVFTSAVRSDPSLSLLATTVGSFRHCPELQDCRVVFVCDGWQVTATATDHRGIRRHCPGKRIVEPDHTKLYAERILALQAAILCSYKRGLHSDGEAPEWVAPHWEILRLPHWHCYGGALRAGLDLVSTPLVLVVQHDFAFVSHVDLRPVAHVMLAHHWSTEETPTSGTLPSVPLHTLQGGACPRLNYCGLLKKAQLHYAMSVRSRSALDIGAPMSIRVPGHSDLVLDRLPQLYDSTHLAGAQWWTPFVAPILILHVNGWLLKRERCCRVPVAWEQGRCGTVACELVTLNCCPVYQLIVFVRALLSGTVGVTHTGAGSTTRASFQRMYVSQSQSLLSTCMELVSSHRAFVHGRYSVNTCWLAQQRYLFRTISV